MAGWRDAVIAGQAAALVAMLALTANVVLRDRDSLGKAIESLKTNDAAIVSKIDAIMAKQNDKYEKFAAALNDTRYKLDCLTDTVMWIARTSYPERLRQMRQFPDLIKKEKEK